MTAQPVTAPARPPLLSSHGIEVRREGVEGSRWYCDPQTDDLYASVSTVISACTSKPWLVPWGAKLAAEYAVDRHDLVAELLRDPEPDAPLTAAARAERAAARRAAAIDHVKREAQRRREAASETGTWVHDVVEALVLDAPMPDVPPQVEPFVDAFIDWHCLWNPTYLAAEATVANPTRGYAGTLDLIAYLPALNRTFLIDAKSGANLDAYMPVQLSAYRRSSEVWLPLGRKARMPAVDALAVLHIRPQSEGGARLIEVPDDESNHLVFLRMLEQLEWRDRQPKAIGRVLYPPLPDGSQPPPLLADIEVPCRAILAEAGILRLDDLAAQTEASLRALKGIGPKKVDALRECLAERGLRLAGEEG